VIDVVAQGQGNKHGRQVSINLGAWADPLFRTSVAAAKNGSGFGFGVEDAYSFPSNRLEFLSRRTKGFLR
jgi:hypothetical protein